MKIAAFILGIALCVIMFLQSCAVYGLGALGDAVSGVEAGSTESLTYTAAGGLCATGFAIIAMAFVLGKPIIAILFYLLGAVVAFVAGKDFPDMTFYGMAMLILALLAFFARRGELRAKRESISST